MSWPATPSPYSYVYVSLPQSGFSILGLGVYTGVFVLSVFNDLTMLMYVFFSPVTPVVVSRDSVVGITTGYGLDD
jgi:hypothetical protein